MDRVATEALKGSGVERWLQQIGHGDDHRRRHPADAGVRRARRDGRVHVHASVVGRRRRRSCVGLGIQPLHPAAEARSAHLHVRRAFSRSARSAFARRPRRPCVQRRHEDGGRRARRSGRPGVPQGVRRAELRPSAQGIAEQPCRAHSAARRASSSRPPC